MHGGDADVARQTQQRIVVAEQPVERVGGRQHQQIVRPPPPLVAPQQVRRAQVLAAARRLDQQIGERHRIAEAQVEPLAGDRMDGVRRVAHQHEARIEVAMGVQRAERIAPAAADHAHRAEMAAEAAGDRAGEARHRPAPACGWAIAVRSVHTMAETLGAPPSSASGLAHIGSCANGPEGRKCSSAVLWCGRSWLIAQTMPVWS